MTAEITAIFHLTVAVAIALAGGLIAHLLRQSVIVGYLLAAMIVGAVAPGITGSREQVSALAEVGVIFLMFALGIQFSLRELASVRAVALVGTGAQILLSLAAGFGLGWLLGWPLLRALFFGAIISISSTMVIVKTLQDRGEVRSIHGRVLLSMLIVQDLVVVVLMVLLPGLAAQTAAATHELGITLLKAVVFIIATILLGTHVIPRFMAIIERLGSAELFLLMAVVIALGTAIVSALIGLSPALGAFMGGLMLTETEFDHRVFAEVVPMRDLFATLFFVSVGLLIDPMFIIVNGPAVIGMALFLVGAKAVSTAAALLPFRLGGKTTVFSALGMIQIGEFSYVLARVGHDIAVIPDYLYTLILTSSLVTIVLTPGAFWIAPRVDLAIARLPGIGRTFRARPIVTAHRTELQDHAVIVGYGRVGSRVAAGLAAAGLPVLVIDEDLHVIRQAIGDGFAAIYGDASYRAIIDSARVAQATVVVVALPDAGATRAVVYNARRANESVPILARVARQEYDDLIRRAGATAIVAPERAGARMLLEQSERLLHVQVPPEKLDLAAEPLASA